MSTRNTAILELKNTLDLATSQATAVFTAYQEVDQPEKDALKREAEKVLNPSLVALKDATDKIL